MAEAQPETITETETIVDLTGPGRGQPPTTDARRWLPTTAIIAYALCRVLTVAGVAVAGTFTHHSLRQNLDIWDGQWFLRAAAHGWPSHLPMAHGHVTANTTAFFPLFPLIIRGASAIGVPPLAAGLVVSALTGLTAVIGVGMLTRHYAGDGAGQRAALLFAVFPGTFAFSLAYAEGLVITCASFGLIALLRRQWWLAGLLGAVATASSPVALAFVASCGWSAGRAIRRQRDWTAVVAPLLAVVGVVATTVYLWRHTGQAMAWRLTERGGWKSMPSFSYPFHVVATFVTDPVAPTLTGQILFVGTVAAVVGLVLMVRERQPAPVLVYGFAAVALAAVSQPVGLRPRFLMVAFPLIMAVGTRYPGRAHRWLVALSATVLLAMTVLELASTAVFP
jgi:hypothetical protein